jgi:hypothetical protein
MDEMDEDDEAGRGEVMSRLHSFPRTAAKNTYFLTCIMRALCTSSFMILTQFGRSFERTHFLPTESCGCKERGCKASYAFTANKESYLPRSREQTTTCEGRCNPGVAVRAGPYRRSGYSHLRASACWCCKV